MGRTRWCAVCTLSNRFLRGLRRTFPPPPLAWMGTHACAFLLRLRWPQYHPGVRHRGWARAMPFRCTLHLWLRFGPVCCSRNRALVSCRSRRVDVPLHFLLAQVRILDRNIHRSLLGLEKPCVWRKLTNVRACRFTRTRTHCTMCYFHRPAHGRITSSHRGA